MTLANDSTLADDSILAGDVVLKSPAPSWIPPTQLLTADPQHGVSIYARHIADQVRLVFPRAAAEDARGFFVSDSGWIHLHFTDRLWGADADAAAATIEDLARRHRVAVTLHDVPQPSDGTNFGRRVRTYRRVIDAASGVVCNSRHEAVLVREFTAPDAAPAVIPLPVTAATPVARPRRLEPAVAILGFVYPGKGHNRAIEAVASLVEDGATTAIRRVVALGRASAGHERDVEELRMLARSRGVVFETTGYLDDREFLRRARRVAVPVIAHDHVSASGSLASWISAGRRPIVVRSRYMEEMADLRPGTLSLVEPGDFVDAIARALQNPETTWLDDDIVVGSTSRDTVAQYLDFWAAVMTG